MLRIGIIIASWHYFSNPFKLQPLHELYYATIVDSYFDDVKVDVIDLRVFRRNELSLHQYLQLVEEYDLFFYWIMKTADYLECINVVNYLRQLYPHSKHVSGGTHITNFPTENLGYFDAVFVGPGEEGLLNVVGQMRENKDISRMYKSSWNKNQLNLHPFPRRKYLPKPAIVNKELFEKYDNKLGTSVMFSRGCDFKCTYCVYNFPSKTQYQSLQKINEEINYLKDNYGVESINLRDEICISLNSKISLSFLETIGKTNVIWRGQTRIGIRKNMLELAAATGCKELAIGVESASETVRKIIRKPASYKQIRDFVEWSHEFGIKIKLCLILGLPSEPLDILDKTIKFIEDIQPDFVAVSGFCPVPGSEIYTNFKDYGIKYIDDDWNKYAHLMCRFDNEEEHGIPFEYEKTNQWGDTISRKELVNIIKELQSYLRNRNMVY